MNTFGVHRVLVQNSAKNPFIIFLYFAGSKTKVTVSTDWNRLQPQTQQRRLRDLKAVVREVVSVAAPKSTDVVMGQLANSLQQTRVSGGKSAPLKVRELLQNLAEAYEVADSTEDRRAILSICATSAALSVLHQHAFSGLSVYCYKKARQHALQHGQGEILKKSKTVRQRKNLDAAVSDFVDYLLQHSTDSPFGENKLKLSSGEIIIAANLIRDVQNEGLVQAYLANCEENPRSFVPLARTSCLTVAMQCEASYRHCVQGLDNFVYFGGEAFKTIERYVTEIGQRTGNTNWVKEKT